MKDYFKSVIFVMIGVIIAGFAYQTFYDFLMILGGIFHFHLNIVTLSIGWFSIVFFFLWFNYRAHKNSRNEEKDILESHAESEEKQAK